MAAERHDTAKGIGKRANARLSPVRLDEKPIGPASPQPKATGEGQDADASDDKGC